MPCEPTPIKKPRLIDPGIPSGSGGIATVHRESNESAPVIVGDPVSIKISSSQAQSSSSTGVMDPLDFDDSQQYHGGEMEGEEGIDFNNLKTEPIQVYSGYEESNQSEMMHNESLGEGKLLI